MIQSILDDSAGFFSMLFFSINQYIYCKKNDISFTLDSNNWLYKSKNGWTDYFSHEIELKGTNKEDIMRTYRHGNFLGEHTMYEYRNVILNDLYIYNEEVKQKIEEKKRELGLINPGTYDSIFIRRGDKLFSESKFYSTENYIELLLQKNPNCQKIFIQTDDYNCFLDIQKYIQEKNIDIKIFTLCHPDTKGMVVFETRIDIIVNSRDEKHKEYFESIRRDLEKVKPVNRMTHDEKYQHTLDMLNGIDIVLHSNICVLDNQSNVSRFINITHDNINNVFDIRFPNEIYDMNRTKCPCHE